MKSRNLVAGALLTLLMESALAVPVVLDITFDNFPEETAFGIWDAAMAPTDLDVLLDPFLFDGPPLSSNAGIAFDPFASSLVGNLDGYAPFFSFFFATPGVPYHFDWDLAAGTYEFIIADLFGDGICCFFGNGSYSLSVGGTLVGGGGAFQDIDRIRFMVPEPGTLALLGLGLFGIGAARRRTQ